MAEKPTDKPAAKKPRISVLERRLKNPHGTPASEIDLTIPGMSPRWFNSDITSDKIWKAKHMGWEPVTPDLLADKEQVGGFLKSPDGYVTRGQRHQEVLMYMPTADRDAIQMAKTRENLKAMNRREPVIEAAAQQYGDQAANFLTNARVVGGVTDNYERIQSTPESN